MADTRIETLPAPTQPSDLDGWTADDLEAWLPDAARKVAAAEVTIDEMRTAVGLVLYRLRIELGDGKYGEAVDRVARDAGLTAATLGRWRTAAERHFQLPAPSVRTVAQRAREADPLTRRQKRKPKEIGAAPAVARTGDTQAPEVQPDAAAYGGSPSAAGAVPARGAQQPSGPLPQPTTKQDYRRLVSLLIAAGPTVLATSVGHDELAAARSVLTKALAVEGTPRNPRPAQTGRCSCQPPKPKARQGAAGLVCEGCGALR